MVSHGILGGAFWISQPSTVCCEAPDLAASSSPAWLKPWALQASQKGVRRQAAACGEEDPSLSLKKTNSRPKDVECEQLVFVPGFPLNNCTSFCLLCSCLGNATNTRIYYMLSSGTSQLAAAFCGMVLQVLYHLHR